MGIQTTLASNNWMDEVGNLYGRYLVTNSQISSNQKQNIFHLLNYLTMPFTAADIVIFFEDPAYMALSNRIMTALTAEGIAVPDNLSEYDKEGMSNIYSQSA